MSFLKRKKKFKYIIEVNPFDVKMDSLKGIPAYVVMTSYVGKDGSRIKIHKI